MNFWRYLWHDRGTATQLSLTVAFLIVFALLTAGVIPVPPAVIAMWQNWTELLFSFATITVAVAIWYNEKKQDWERRLPKRLDVSFWHGDRVFYRVVNAPLVGENDARAWGQQLGLQMYEGRLEFRELDLKPPRREKDSSDRWVMRYELTIWLKTVAAGKMERTWRYDDNGRVIEETASAGVAHL